MIHNSGYRWDYNPEAGFCDTESYFSVNCCGYEKYITKDVKTLREKGRLDYQLIYMINGRGSFRVNEEMTDMSSGSMIIYRPGEIQQYAYQCRDMTELYWVHFTGTGAQEYLGKVGIAKGSIHYVGLHNAYIEYFKKIMLELQLKEPLYRETADAAILELLALMGRDRLAAANKSKRFVDSSIRGIMEQMHTEYGKHWSIDEMARQCSLSPNRFMHKFKAQTGVSAMDYIITIRMDKAKDLLANSSLSIKEISNLIGYENPLYFSRLFSKVEGLSPRDYRRKVV